MQKEKLRGSGCQDVWVVTPPHLPGQSVLVFVGEGHGPWWEMEECEECGPGVAINYRELHTIDIVKLNTQLSSPDFLVKLDFQPILKALNNMETSEILLAFLWTFNLDQTCQLMLDVIDHQDLL